MKVGLKKDMVWRESWNIFCQSSGLYTTDERDPKKHTADSLTGFIEANLGEVLSRDWVKEFLVDPDLRRSNTASTKEPKRKKKKKEKKKKRKREDDSSSESSSDEAAKAKVQTQWGENEAPPSPQPLKKEKAEKKKKVRKIDDVDL
jgi:hypothetical protein